MRNREPEAFFIRTFSQIDGDSKPCRRSRRLSALEGHKILARGLVLGCDGANRLGARPPLVIRPDDSAADCEAARDRQWRCHREFDLRATAVTTAATELGYCGSLLIFIVMYARHIR